MVLSKILFGAVGALALLAPATAAAQSPRPMNVAFGFAAISDPHTDNLTPGWNLSGAMRLDRVTKSPARIARLHRMSSLVLEADGGYGSAGDTANVRVHAAMAGLRLAREREDAKFWPFGQLLLGAECYCGTTATLGDLFRGFSFQPGAGVDWPFTRSLAVRIQADVRHTVGGDNGVTRFRIATGAVFRFGPSGSDAAKTR